MATTYNINNRIELSISPESPYKEMYAAEEIMPGEFVYPTAADEVSLKGVSIVAVPLWIAVANTRHGKTIEDAYAIGDRVMIRVLRKGDIVLTWIGGSGVPGVGSKLRNIAGGILEVNASGDVFTVATSLEQWTAISAPERIKVRAV